jgi:uncharacterized protein
MQSNSLKRQMYKWCKMNDFIGRKQELQKLQRLLKKSSSSLIVVRGRRRIGKSRLIEEFGKNQKTYIFSGIPPTEKTTKEDQLREFGWQLGKALGQPPFLDKDWNDLFLRLASHTRRGRVIILFDEISWMGSEDPQFLSKLKNAWDLEFKKNPNLIFVLCGSVSFWIEKNILSSTGFLGRISLDLFLEELSLKDCNQFWDKGGQYVSAYEKFKVLAVTGGVPKYLEEITPEYTAEENIKNLCFDKSGLLFNEFDNIFSDIFSKRSEIYKKIVTCIDDGHYQYEEIYRKLGIEKSGSISEYLKDLTISGFIKRDYTWHIKTGKRSKLSYYRISDNYLRFYLTNIFPNEDKIRRGSFQNLSLGLIPGWESILGLQFENLVLHNRRILQELLNIKPEDITYENPFFQTKTARQEGCQIDYMIQTRFDVLYVCEIKFSKHPIESVILEEMKQKIKKLRLPKRMSCRPILIHVNGVNEAVLHSRYFSDIIDFSQLLT